LKAIFADAPVEHARDHYCVSGFRGAPRPLQRPHPPLMIGSGGRRVLELAAREADVVSLNFDNRAGVLGPDGVERSTAEATAAKVSWVREAAGRASPRSSSRSAPTSPSSPTRPGRSPPGWARRSGSAPTR
jgi:alkanesulfonate monooxygenase SsuD/methylene tetrahydromethanopterin reductase-like flavin-dependent oxidoreductase (luciferase family)